MTERGQFGRDEIAALLAGNRSEAGPVPQMTRAVVTDATEIVLTLYAPGGALASIMLEPGAALRLAHDLLGAAIRRN